MHLKNIKAGNPKTPEQYQLTKEFDVIWLWSEDERNWYEEQKNFQQDTLKIAYNKKGIICCVENDVSLINPEGMSVIELPDITSNRRADNSGRWIFDGEKIIDGMTLEKAKAHKTAEINVWRNEQEVLGTTFELDGRIWDASQGARSRLEPIMALLNSGGVLPDGLFWTDANNNDVPATKELLMALYDGMLQAMVTQGFKIHERQRQMKEDLDKLTTAKDVESFKVGWIE